MPSYRRRRILGGVYFFTVVTYLRRHVFTTDVSSKLLKSAMAEARQRLPFSIDAIVLLPDHLHMVMRLPEGDDDFPARLAKIKRNFTEAYLAAGGRDGPSNPSRQRQRYRGVWQKRYYEHAICDYDDFKRHLDYVHANPVKHGLAHRPSEWAWSTFHRYVESGEYAPDWCGHIELPGGFDIEPDGW